MGFLKNFFKNEESNDNFTLIAENMATIYYIIKESQYGSKLTENQILYATGFIDTLSYLMSESITDEEIKQAVTLGYIGQCKLDTYLKPHRAMLEFGENQPLIGMIMQIECLIFYQDTGMRARELIDMVISQKEKIEAATLGTLAQGSESKYYNDLFPLVMQILNDEYVEVLKELSF